MEKAIRRKPIKEKLIEAVSVISFAAVILTSFISLAFMFRIRNGSEEKILEQLERNVTDLVEDRVIDKSEMNKFEKENGIKIMEVSAKTGDGIDKAFEYIIQKLIENNEKKNSNTLTLQGGNNNNKQGCC